MKTFIFVLIFAYTGQSLALSIHKDDPKCIAKKSKLNKGETYFAYTHGDFVLPLAILKNGKLTKAKGNKIANNSWIFDIKSGDKLEIKFRAYWERMGTDRCEYYSELIKKVSSKNKILLLSSSSDIKINFDIPSSVKDSFIKRNPKCVDQGDYPPDKKPPCTRPKLIATSDLNNNSKSEYWFTDPWLWDTGFKIAEWDDVKKEFKSIVTSCTGCD